MQPALLYLLLQTSLVNRFAVCSIIKSCATGESSSIDLLSEHQLMAYSSTGITK